MLPHFRLAAVLKRGRLTQSTPPLPGRAGKAGCAGRLWDEAAQEPPHPERLLAAHGPKKIRAGRAAVRLVSFA